MSLPGDQSGLLALMVVLLPIRQGSDPFYRVGGTGVAPSSFPQTKKMANIVDLGSGGHFRGSQIPRAKMVRDFSRSGKMPPDDNLNEDLP